jgi:hypothetical protein
MTSEYKRALTGSPQAYTQTQGTTMTYGAQAATLLNLSRAESGDTVSNLLVQIDPTALGGFADEVIQLLNNDAVSSGDLHVFMQFFVRFFETNDIYYGALSQAFNIPESILT